MPYIILLTAFGSFVIWNGSVVLGKLRSLLSLISIVIWNPAVFLFSPQSTRHTSSSMIRGTAFLNMSLILCLGDKENHVASIHLAQMLYIWPFITFFSLPMLWPWLVNGIVPQQLLPRQLRFHKVRCHRTAIVVGFGFLGVSLGIVHYNTIVHPFTLADNRHYMFYIFRILLSKSLLKYLVVPVYGYCALAAIAALGGLESTQDFSIQKELDGVDTKQGEQALNTRDKPPNITPQGKSVTFVLVWLLTTALCLVTAPLVEPRYSILAWLFWRLQLPVLQPLALSQKGSNVRNDAKALWNSAYDHRLILETAWFMFINVVTGYMFLYKGFEWPQEPGNVQRFMW